jgi:hypothetical protein
MKIRRKGRRNGLDIDYHVDVADFNEADQLHRTLLKDGLLFMYMKGDKPYNVPTENTVLHYIDNDLNLYDYTIVIEGTSLPASPRRVAEPDYAEKIKTPEFKEYMKQNKVFNAFVKHLKAYGKMSAKHKKVFKTLGVPTDYSLDSVKEIQQLYKNGYLLGRRIMDA